jgi:hypothetical protein
MQAKASKRGGEVGAARFQRVMVMLTGDVAEAELIDHLQRQLVSDEAKVVVVSPTIEKSPLHHGLGDFDTAAREARSRLDRFVTELRKRGISAFGEVGDRDPVVAAADALRQYPADEVLYVARRDGQPRWFEDGLVERARESLYPPVRVIGRPDH